MLHAKYQPNRLSGSGEEVLYNHHINDIDALAEEEQELEA